MRAVFEHGGANGEFTAQHIVFDDNEGNACGSKVFLRTRVNERILAYVCFFAHNARGQVRNEGYAVCVGKSVIFRAENGVVFGDVNVACVLSEIGRGCLGNVGEFLVFAGRDESDIAIFLCFFVRFFGKVARHDIIRFSRFEQVERNCLELCGSTALHHNHVIVFGDLHKFAHQVETLGIDCVIPFGAVAHLHNAHTRAVIICNGFSRLLQYLDGEHGRTCGKVVNSHKFSFLLRY